MRKRLQRSLTLLIGVFLMVSLQNTAFAGESDSDNIGLSAYISAMGGVEFGEGLLESGEITENEDGTYTITLYLTTSSVTIYSVTCETFVDASESAPGYYDSSGTLKSADYTLSEETAVNADGEAVHYVDSMSFTVDQLDETFYLYLYINSSVMGQQFSNGEDSKYAAVLSLYDVDHVLTYVKKQAAACTEDGHIAYYVCELCGKYFKDADGTDELSEDDLVLEAIGHSYSGNVCESCGALKSADLSEAAVTLFKDTYTYNGSARKPAVTVTINGTRLTKGTDYSVTYKNNTSAGTATVTVKGTGAYSGSYKTTFTINAKSLSSATVTLSKTSYTYNGSAKKPTPTVKLTLNGSTKTLKKNTDYTVTYSNNTKAGTATVKITGTGNYKGTAKATFTIKKASQSLTVTTSTKTVKYSKVKSAKQTVKSITKVSGAKGSVTYKKTSGSKYLSVSSTTGKITVKKGTPKGTYKIKVKVQSASTTNYKAASKTVTITVKVK